MLIRPGRRARWSGVTRLPVTLGVAAGPLRMLQMLVVDGTKAYLVVGTSPAASFGRHEAAIRASLLSFTVG
jgi:hypothetical protein